MGPEARPSRVEIAVSLRAGNGRALACGEALERVLRARGYSTRLQSFGDLRAFARWSLTCREPFSYLVCVGGDATMSAAAPAAIRHGAPLLPVPSGFANLFARTFGHSNDPMAAADLLESGEVVGIDAGSLNGEIFLCLESYGLLKDVQVAVEEENGGPPKPKLRRLLSYCRMAGRFLHAPPWSFRVEADGALLASDAVLVTVANIRAYGGWLPLTPDASPIDGSLDVLVIPRTTGLGLWGRLLRFLIHLPPRENEVILRRARRISIRARGKPAEEIRVLPGALPVLVPRAWQARMASRTLPRLERVLKARRSAA